MTMTPWENDVAEAMRCAYTGWSENWPATARVLAAEVTELRAKVATAQANIHDALASVPDPGYETQVPHGV